MRNSLRCPKCASRKLWRIHPFQIPDHDSSNGVKDFPAIARDATGRADYVSHDDRIAVGKFEVWICSGCGLTEWYATNGKRGPTVNDTLARLAANPQSGVLWVDGDAASPR